MSTSLIIGKSVSYPVIKGETFPRSGFKRNQPVKLKEARRSSSKVNSVRNNSSSSRGQVSNSDQQQQSNQLRQQQQSSGHQLITIGIYGWRKKFLYALIILVSIFVVINAALTFWIVRLLNFRLDRIGKIILTEEGIIVDGKSFCRDTLSARYIKSRKDGNLRIISSDSLNLETISSFGDDDIVNLISLSNDSVKAWINEMRIATKDNKPLITINDSQLTVHSTGLRLNNTFGVQFNSSIQSPMILSDPYHDLRLQSKTRSVLIEAARQVNLSSNSEMSLTSRKDIKVESKSGKIILDSDNIELSNLKLGIPMLSQEVYPGVYQVCICGNGRLFMALPREPCTYDVKICEYVHELESGAG